MLLWGVCYLQTAYSIRIHQHGWRHHIGVISGSCLAVPFSVAMRVGCWRPVLISGFGGLVCMTQCSIYSFGQRTLAAPPRYLYHCASACAFTNTAGDCLLPALRHPEGLAWIAIPGSASDAPSTTVIANPVAIWAARAQQYATEQSPCVLVLSTFYTAIPDPRRLMRCTPPLMPLGI